MRFKTVLCGGLLVSALSFGVAGAQGASRPFLPEFPLNGLEGREALFEGACGVGTDAAADVYVSEYYRDQIDIYNPSLSNVLAKITNLSPANGPCALAVNLAGRLFVNAYHEGVVELVPSTFPPHQGTTYTPQGTIDSNESTGLALDPTTGDLYINDRTYIARYESPITPGEEPAEKIGLGTLKDGYGLAISSFPATEGDLYVPDAASNTLKVYDPGASLTDPVEEIDGAGTPQGGFTSLVDSAVAVDPANGNILVADNLQPGFEAPAAVIDELSPQGQYLGQLPHAITDSQPPGIALAGEDTYVTSGNGEGSALYGFGAPTAFAAAPLSQPPPPGGGQSAAAIQGPPPPSPAAAPKRPAAAASETTQQGSLRVSFQGQLSPHALPRQGQAPVHATVATKIATTGAANPPQLRRISIAINRHGHFDPTGLPVCPLEEIQPSTTANALAACRDSLVGEGLFEAKVLLSQQSPFPSQGKVYAFNSVLDGHPAILAHVYGTSPVPTSFTLPFELHSSKGTFGTTLIASLPQVTGNSAYVTGISLKLFRRFTYKGKARSYISAGCPAPKGASKALFPFARASLDFKGGRRVRSTLLRSCGVG